MDREKTKKTTKMIKIGIVVIACACYGVLPADIIPDLVPLFGLVDDAAVLLGSAVYIISVIRNKRKPVGRNKELNERLQIMRADMENNYKDAAQLDFKKACSIYEELLASGKMSEAEKDYYEQQMAAAREELSHFTHFEGPGSGLYNSKTSDGLLQIGKH